MPKPIKIIWDEQAREDLKMIYDFIKIKSPQGVRNVINDILERIKSIHFTEQYQIDEFLGPPYRRMIVRDYKIIYKVNSVTEIRILYIFDTKQNPNKLRS